MTPFDDPDLGLCGNAAEPPNGRFGQQWHAQVLAMANGLIEAGKISADDWAQSLGAALQSGVEAGNPDTEESYYLAALVALETVTIRNSTITSQQVDARKTAWEQAYLSTPHGEPVQLKVMKD